MKKKVKRTLYTILFAVTCLITVPALLRAVIFMFKHIYMYWWFLGGGVLYLVASLFILKKNMNFLQTLSHESLHMAACLMMFRKVESLRATASNGGVVYHYGDSNMFISLAPYTIPVVTILLLLIQTVIPARFMAFGIVVGFTFFFYLHSFISQAKPYQTDLKNHGLAPAYLYIISLASFNIAICLLAVDMKLFKAIGFYFTDIWNTLSAIF